MLSDSRSRSPVPQPVAEDPSALAPTPLNGSAPALSIPVVAFGVTHHIAISSRSTARDVAEAVAAVAAGGGGKGEAGALFLGGHQLDPDTRVRALPAGEALHYHPRPDSTGPRTRLASFRRASVAAAAAANCHTGSLRTVGGVRPNGSCCYYEPLYEGGAAPVSLAASVGTHASYRVPIHSSDDLPYAPSATAPGSFCVPSAGGRSFLARASVATTALSSLVAAPGQRHGALAPVAGPFGGSRPVTEAGDSASAGGDNHARASRRSADRSSSRSPPTHDADGRPTVCIFVRLPSSTDSSKLRELRVAVDFPAGALRELFAVDAAWRLVVGDAVVADERRTLADLGVEPHAVVSFVDPAALEGFRSSVLQGAHLQPLRRGSGSLSSGAGAARQSMDGRPAAGSVSSHHSAAAAPAASAESPRTPADRRPAPADTDSATTRPYCSARKPRYPGDTAGDCDDDDDEDGANGITSYGSGDGPLLPAVLFRDGRAVPGFAPSGAARRLSDDAVRARGGSGSSAASASWGASDGLPALAARRAPAAPGVIDVTGDLSAIADSDAPPSPVSPSAAAMLARRRASSTSTRDSLDDASPALPPAALPTVLPARLSPNHAPAAPAGPAGGGAEPRWASHSPTPPREESESVSSGSRSRSPGGTRKRRSSPQPPRRPTSCSPYADVTAAAATLRSPVDPRPASILMPSRLSTASGGAAGRIDINSSSNSSSNSSNRGSSDAGARPSPAAPAAAPARLRITLQDPAAPGKCHCGLPVEPPCPVGVLRQWLQEEHDVAAAAERARREERRKSGKATGGKGGGGAGANDSSNNSNNNSGSSSDGARRSPSVDAGETTAVTVNYYDKVRYGIFCNDARVPADGEDASFATVTRGKNDCIFSLRELQ